MHVRLKFIYTLFSFVDVDFLIFISIPQNTLYKKRAKGLLIAKFKLII